jgi:hypothetical protein
MYTRISTAFCKWFDGISGFLAVCTAAEDGRRTRLSLGRIQIRGIDRRRVVRMEFLKVNLL